MKSVINRVNRALEQLKEGKIVLVMDAESRENEGDFILAAEFTTQETMNFLIKEAGGLVCVPMTKEIAQKFDLYPMVTENQDSYQTAFTVSVDHASTHTGISAIERAITCNELTNLTNTPSDFKRPGHIFPLIAKDKGVLVRAGHTEAAVDLMKLANLTPVAVICEVLNEDGSMARKDDLKEIATRFDIPFLTIQDIIDYRLTCVPPISHADLPTEYGLFDIYTFPNSEGSEPHVVLRTKNRQEGVPLTVRVHSECLTGDIFHSVKCDCSAQLNFGLKTIADSENGMLIYLRQEGRGIGLSEKIKAYALQDKGQDTVDANLSLGHPVDARDFSVAAKILNYFNETTVKLITNNPEKIQALKLNDIEVLERIATPRFTTKENEHYLQTKITRLGHLL